MALDLTGYSASTGSALKRISGVVADEAVVCQFVELIGGDTGLDCRTAGHVDRSADR